MWFACEVQSQLHSTHFLFHLCLMAAVDLALSASDHLCSVANWISGFHWPQSEPTDNNHGDGVYWSGPQSRGFAGWQASPYNVSSLTFEFGPRMETANGNAWLDRVQGLHAGFCQQGQRKLCGELHWLLTQKLLLLGAIILRILPA